MAAKQLEAVEAVLSLVLTGPVCRNRKGGVWRISCKNSKKCSNAIQSMRSQIFVSHESANNTEYRW